MLDLEKSKKYVLACSFGPDSMALFSMLYNEGYSFVVAHVNYHKRDASNFEEESLRKYCEERDIQIEVLSAPHSPEKTNFQEWARELRYDFFRKCLNKHECDAVLVAHQEDDFIETYIMQKERGSDVNFY
ncbi:MAG: tRNA lysidine(34) synthetase TilS, partial [Bacilli bacterium]|nr:tRNA lysidine(34) synthetase TilS [Bacilli bacterium]